MLHDWILQYLTLQYLTQELDREVGPRHLFLLLLGNLGNGFQLLLGELLGMRGEKSIQLLRLHVVKAFPSHLPCQPANFMPLLHVGGKASEVLYCLWPQVVPAGVDGGGPHLIL